MFVLIVGDNPGVRTALESAIADFGLDWQIERTGDDAAALAIAAQRAVDVAVVDLRSPGVDGPTLLAAIRQRYPEVVRLLVIEDSQQNAAMRVLESAHRFLNKPLRADELIEAIESVGELREILDSPQLKALIGAIGELPPAPSLYLKLTKALSDPNAAAGTAATLVAQDPVMASKVLRLCNSAFFSGGRAVADIRTAVVRLGQENLRRLVLASEVFSGSQADNGIDREAMQLRALRASQLAGRLLGGSSAELAATAALLSDVGMLLPGVSIPRPDEPATNDMPHYAEAGAYLLGLWGLPMPIVEAVASHHQPGKSRSRGFWVGGAVHVA
ncbi:MAG: HDOD domain-containing protein, partial [Pseudomonas sp.]|nr:HDOD domain-containing protein [Pseudomonas sp.]